MMNYQQTLDYLFAQLPMFHRIGPAAYKANLDNTIAMAKHLGNPERTFKSIHIAGTNGKGSVAHMLASVFQQAGYKTGLCTSPHLKDFRERFRINGKMMPREFVTDFVNKHTSLFQSLQPSFFEMTIAMTFDFFARQKVDIAIIETGLGGRLDSTNIISPEVSVITNIGLDHTNLLGNTLEAIAMEKAGIIKPGIPVVIGKSRPRVHTVFKEKALQTGSEILFAEEHYQACHPVIKTTDGLPALHVSMQGIEKSIDLQSALTGTYQYENLCTALTAIDVINKQGRFEISEKDLKEGIKNVVLNTGIAGRWQVLEKKPLVICDTGHNVDGIKSILENIGSTPHRNLHFVLGMMNDKDISGILDLLPVQNTVYYFCKPDVPRGLESHELRRAAHEKGLRGKDYASVKEALIAAKASATEVDFVFVGGSTFVVAEVV